jgi:hypothetical protein
VAHTFVVEAVDTAFYVVDGIPNNPTLTLTPGRTYVFNNTACQAHPLFIKMSFANGYDLDQYNAGVSGQGGAVLVFSVPLNGAPPTLYYQCSQHPFTMYGTLQVGGTGPLPAAGVCCSKLFPCTVVNGTACTLMGGLYLGDGTACDGLSLCPFVDALRVPPVATPVSGAVGSTASYVLRAQQFSGQLHRDLPPTTLWGFESAAPGPTIRAAVGMPVTVTWVNDLRAAGGAPLSQHALAVDSCLPGADVWGARPRSSVHLHGAHTRPDFDGAPDLPMLPGQNMTFVYPNAQRGSTMWYHDHALGITRLNVQVSPPHFAAGACACHVGPRHHS